MTRDSVDSVLSEILNERSRQVGTWGVQDHVPAFWLAILTEEIGEAARAICKAGVPPYDPGDTDSYLWNLREELVQVAAVAIAAIESLDRNELRADR